MQATSHTPEASTTATVHAPVGLVLYPFLCELQQAIDRKSSEDTWPAGTYAIENCPGDGQGFRIIGDGSVRTKPFLAYLHTGKCSDIVCSLPLQTATCALELLLQDVVELSTVTDASVQPQAEFVSAPPDRLRRDFLWCSNSSGSGWLSEDPNDTWCMARQALAWNAERRCYTSELRSMGERSALALSRNDLPVKSVDEKTLSEGQPVLARFAARICVQPEFLL